MWSLREIALSKENFKTETRLLKRELRADAALFEKAPFGSGQDKLRYYLLKLFPLSVYKTILRLRHGG